MWVRIAVAAGDGVAGIGPGDLAAGRVFMERAMPETALRLARITAGAETLMAAPEERVLDVRCARQGHAILNGHLFSHRQKHAWPSSNSTASTDPEIPTSRH